MPPIDFAKLLAEEKKKALLLASGKQQAPAANDNFREKDQSDAALEAPQFELAPRDFMLNEQHRIKCDTMGDVFFINNFVSVAEETSLLECCHHPAHDKSWVTLSSRRLQHWGLAPNHIASGPTSPMPPWLENVVSALVSASVFSKTLSPNNCLLNEYKSGQGIMPHTDGPCYEPRVATLSLGSDCILSFRPLLKTKDIGIKNDSPVLSVVLPRRSLVVFSKEAYTDYMHGIEAVREESIDFCEDAKPRPIANLNESIYKPGDKIERGDRVSLTFRRVKVG
eukprot:m.205620 g.205620  ORF g.205620 m.205620 type:complete len:281 (-) comp15786_c0_seq11:6736-7578(-)